MQNRACPSLGATFENGSSQRHRGARWWLCRRIFRLMTCTGQNHPRNGVQHRFLSVGSSLQPRYLPPYRTMRRSRRADADTPRDTPGNVEAVRAAANAASSEGSESDVQDNSFRVASSPRHGGLNHHSISEYTPCTRARFPLDHALGEDTMSMNHRKVGRSVMDDESSSGLPESAIYASI